jgi:hypothetical protein
VPGCRGFTFWQGNQLESVKIHIANREPFQCPLGLTAAEATRQISAKYNLRHSGIYRNGAGVMLHQIISEGRTFLICALSRES